MILTISETVRSQLYVEESQAKEPERKETGWGRPTKNSTTRKKRLFEHVDIRSGKYKKNSSGGRSSSGSKRGRGPSSSVTGVRFTGINL